MHGRLYLEFAGMVGRGQMRGLHIQYRKLLLFQRRGEKRKKKQFAQHISALYRKVVVSREFMEANFICHCWQKDQELLTSF